MLVPTDLYPIRSTDDNQYSLIRLPYIRNILASGNYQLDRKASECDRMMDETQIDE